MTVVITPTPARFDFTGVAFVTYARRYSEAAGVARAPRDVFDPVPLQLYCQSLELYLKAFIWLKDRSSQNVIKNKYRHDLIALWRDSKSRGIARYCRITRLRESVISLVGPYYKRRAFAYLDLDMVFRGYRNLKAQPKAVPTLKRLVVQLDKAVFPLVSATP